MAKELLAFDYQEASPQGIKVYTEYLMAFLQEVVAKTVPWRRRSVYATLWWSDEISQAVHEERGLKRQWLRTRSDSD
jgi:hypothetical protein